MRSVFFDDGLCGLATQDHLNKSGNQDDEANRTEDVGASQPRQNGEERNQAQPRVAVSEIRSSFDWHGNAERHQRRTPQKNGNVFGTGCEIEPPDFPGASHLPKGMSAIADLSAKAYSHNRHGPEFHLRPGKRKERDLHSQFGSACHYVRHDGREADVGGLGRQIGVSKGRISG